MNSATAGIFFQKDESTVLDKKATGTFTYTR